jgi:hypothetical protein
LKNAEQNAVACCRDPKRSGKAGQYLSVLNPGSAAPTGDI